MKNNICIYIINTYKPWNKTFTNDMGGGCTFSRSVSNYLWMWHVVKTATSRHETPLETQTGVRSQARNIPLITVNNMTVSSTEVRWQNRRVHVLDYGSSRVAVKQHEDREGTREKDQDDKTSQSLSAKSIYTRRNHLICNVIKRSPGFAFFSSNVQQAPGARALRSVRVSERHGLLCHDRSHAQQTPSVQQKPNGSEFAYF